MSCPQSVGIKGVRTPFFFGWRGVRLRGIYLRQKKKKEKSGHSVKVVNYPSSRRSACGTHTHTPCIFQSWVAWKPLNFPPTHVIPWLLKARLRRVAQEKIFYSQVSALIFRIAVVASADVVGFSHWDFREDPHKSHFGHKLIFVFVIYSTVCSRRANR